MELSTIVRHGFPTIVIVLDNGGYGTERLLHPGNFNDINPWQYHKLPEIFSGGTGYEVRTEGEFDEALRRAGRHDQHEPDPSPHRPRRPQQRPAPPGRPPQQASVSERRATLTKPHWRRRRYSPAESKCRLAIVMPLIKAPMMPTRPWSVPQMKRFFSGVVPS